jgi:hypothetical protein
MKLDISIASESPGGRRQWLKARRSFWSQTRLSPREASCLNADYRIHPQELVLKSAGRDAQI